MNTHRLSAGLVAAVIIAATAPAALAQKTAKTPANAARLMTAAEIKKMLAGNTLSATVSSPGGSDVRHDIFVAPDGTLRGQSRVGPPLSYDNKFAGAWSTERNQFCFHESAALMWSCPKFQRRSDTELVIIDPAGRSNVVARVTPGNPRGF